MVDAAREAEHARARPAKIARANARRLLLRTTDSILECAGARKGDATVRYDGAFWTGFLSESRIGPRMLTIRPNLVQRPFFAQDCPLLGREPCDGRPGRLHLPVEQFRGKGPPLSGSLDLDKFAGPGHHHVEVDLGPDVFGIVQIDQDRPLDDAD